jgi:hypothetical protein
MAWGIVTGTANGRGFDAEGLLGRIAASVVLPASSHGQGWHLIDDQSGLATNPYIVIANKPLPWVHSAWPKILKIVLPTSTPGYVYAMPLYSYNVTTKYAPYWSYSYLKTVDAGYFNFWLRGGETGMFFHTWPGGETNPFWCGLSDLQPNNNEYEDQSHSGTSIDGAFEVTGDPTSIISGWDGLIGLTSSTTDTNGNIYLSIINTSGANYRLDLFRDAARLERVGFSTTFTGSTTGVRTFTADTTYSAGVTGNLSNLLSLSPNTGIACRTRSLILQSGEGANITVGKYYFLMQLDHLTSVRISFSKVIAKYGDRIVFDRVRSGMPFTSGTYVSPQPLRHYFWGTRIYTTAGGTYLCLPLLGKQGSEYVSSVSTTNLVPRHNYEFPESFIGRVSPDLYGRYRISHGIVYEGLDESNQSTGLVSCWGSLKNLGFGSSAGITIMSNGRSEAGVDYLACHPLNTGFLMVRDTETTEPD